MEVVSIVGGAILSYSVEMLLNKLASSNFLNFASREGIADDLEKLKSKLHKIRMVLDVAEEQTNNRLVNDWLCDFRDLAFDIEDIVDEFETEAYLQRNSDVDSHGISSKIRKLCDKFRPRAIKFYVEMASKIKDVSTRLEEITKLKDDLNLKEIPARSSNRLYAERLPTTYLPQRHVYGREKEQEEIIQKLLSVDATDATDVNFSVIPIQDMGGIGKSTLARLVYNNDKVQKYFDRRAWVCVSDCFDVFQITKTIRQSFMSCDANDLNLLQEKLKEKLYGKKILDCFR